MKFKLLTWIFAIVLLSSFASADKTVQGYDIDCTDPAYWLCNDFDTNYNGFSYTAGSGVINVQQGFMNVTDTSSDNIMGTTNAVFNTSDWSMEFTMSANDDNIYNFFSASGNFLSWTMNFPNIQDDADIVFTVQDGSVVHDTGFNYVAEHNISVIINKTGNVASYRLYYNGSNLENYTLVADANFGNALRFSWFGNNAGDRIKIYNFMVWAGTQEDAPYLTITPTFDYINLSTAQPNNYNTTSSTIYFNLTANATYNFNCSLGLNNTLNETKTYTAGLNVPVNFTKTIADGSWSYNISCVQANDTTQNETTTTNLFFIDTVVPVISVNPFSNNDYAIYKSNKSISINCTDANLYSINITIDGVTIFNRTNIGATTISYNLTYNDFASLPYGVHYLGVTCKDGHTDVLINDFDVTKGTIDNSLTYKFGKDYIKILPKTTTLFSSMDTKKESDRYTFELQRDALAKLLYGEDIEIRVISSQALDINNKEGYKGWIVSDVLNKWIDFENDDEASIVSLRQVDKNTIDATIRGIKSDTILFRSIGSLNIVSVNYSFYIGNLTETYVNPQIETADSIFTLNFTKNVSYISNINAVLSYNGTNYGAVKTDNTAYTLFTKTISLPLMANNITNATFYWLYNITGITANESNTTTIINQSIYQMLITNCSGYSSNVTLNFTYIDELNLNKITASAQGLFEVWYENSLLKKNFSVQYSADATSSKYCIFPDFATLNTDYQFIFTNSSYTPNTFYMSGSTLSTSTQYFDIFFLSSTNGTAISVYVLDEYSNPSVGTTVEAWRYNLATNNYTLMRSGETDIAGLTIMTLFTTNDEYKFLAKIDGVTVKETEKMKLYSTTYTLRLPTTSAVTIPAQVISNLDYTLNFNETTRNATLTWSDLTNIGNKYYLEVYQNNATNGTLLASQSSTANSGILYYIIPNTTQLYAVNFYLNYTADGVKYFVDGLTIQNIDERVIFGVESVLLALLFIGSITFLGISISIEIAMVFLIAGLIAMYAIGFISLGISGGITALMSIISIAIMIMFKVKR